MRCGTHRDTIDIINIENKKLFILCLDTSATSSIVKEKLVNLFRTLKEILKEILNKKRYLFLEYLKTLKS